MNKKLKLTVIKKLFSIWVGVFCIVLLSCNNFLEGSSFKEQLDEDIAYAEAKECRVIIKSDAAYGSFLSDGEKTFKVGYDSPVQFTVKTESYAFKGLEAVSSTDTSLSRSECVQFTALESDDKKGVYKFNVKLIKAADDILIRPVCTLLPKISSISPALEANGCNQDSAITIAFNKNMNPASFKDTNGKITGLSITNGDDEDLSAYFDEPYFASDNKTLVIRPLCYADNPKFLLPPDESKSSLNIKVNYTFVDVKDEDGLSFTENGTHNYKINKNFNKQEEVTVIVQNPDSSYGSFLSAGEKSCIVGFGFEIEFTLNTESYNFEGFEAVSKNDTSLSRADFIAYENEQNDEENGVYRAKVRVLKAASDILIRPKCTLIENAEVTIIGKEGVKSISPASGTTVQSFVKRNYSIRFTPDDDYEFIRWVLYDINTGEEIPNETYVTIAKPYESETSYEVTQVPANTIKLGLRAAVVERPQLISNTPQNGGILKDSTIQVLFDRDMDEYSIYYTDDEIDELLALGVKKDEFLPEIPTGLQNNYGYHYGYTKNGETYLKNISLTNNKDGSNLNDKFDAPFFENARTLSIPASKEDGKTLDDYTQVLVSIEKGFFYSEKIDETTSKPVTLRGIKKWSYQVTNHGDEDALVFQKKNGNDLFTLKLENTENAVQLSDTNEQPTIGNDGNGIKNLNFLKIKNEKPTLYCDMELQDVTGGSGPNSTFTIKYERIKEGDYLTAGQGENVTGSFGREYTATTSQDAIFKGDLSLDLPADGIYRIWFDFTDRSQNHFYYPTDAEKDSNVGFYVVKDTTAPNGKDEKISASEIDDSSYFKLSWNPVGIDFSEAIVSYKTNGTQTASYTVKKGENDNSQALMLDSMSDKYEVSIVYKDFAGNKSETYEIPKFMTGFTATESTKKVLFSRGPLSDNGFTATAHFSDGTTGDISSSSIITSSATNIASEVEATFTSGEITRKSSLPGTYLVAQSDAKTERPVKLTNYTGTLSGGTYYKFGDFPQTISALTGENAYTDEPVYKGWYLGSDGYFYEKCTENAYKSGYTYSNNTPVAEASANSEKYFKVEPIKWRVLNPSASGKKILLAESILTANIPYYGSTSSRQVPGEWSFIPSEIYKYSNIRAYLNGTANQFETDYGSYEEYKAIEYNVDWTGKGFLQTAFTPPAQNLIATTTVDNSARSTNPAEDPTAFNSGDNGYAWGDTKDKIFLLSEKEATTTAYGFSKWDNYDQIRIRVPTDYAKANYASSEGDNKSNTWLLRSPSPTGGARCIQYKGMAGYSRWTREKDSGIVPALCVSASYLP